MLQTTFVRDDDVEPLAEGVCAVLQEVGVFCQNEQMLKALEAAGARVDYADQRARFPREMVTEFVEELRRGHAAAVDVHAHFIAPGLAGLGTQVAQFFYDYEKLERCSGNKQDFITLTKLGEVLHGDSGVGHSLLLTDVPPLLEPLEAGVLLAEYASTPAPPFAWNVKQVDYLSEMGEVLGLKNWFAWGAVCFAHPLRFDRDVADKFVPRVKAGAPTGLTAMPVAGVTTPVTVEGFIVVSSAEHLATWMAARALNPEVPLGGSMWAGTVDMKTGEVSYCAFDAMFYAFASVEFLQKWCGMEVVVGGGEYCAAKKPGIYAAIEKAYKAMTIAAFTGRHPEIGQGMLEDGKTLSPVQLLLERDLGAGLQHYARNLEANAENIGLSTILDVGVGLKTSYVQTEHTLHHYRSCLWLPEFIERAGWNGFDAEADVLRKAQAKVNALLAEYAKPEGREEQLAAMREVLEKARKQLLR